MRVASVFVLAALFGCQTNQAAPTVEAPVAGHGAVPASPVAPPSLAWSPETAVDVASLVTQRYFVLSQNASVCPTPSQALANECGNSVEAVDLGYRLFRGQIVTVVGEGPEDGVWKAIRYTKAGTLPGWIDSGRVGSEPSMGEADKFMVGHIRALRFRSDELELASKRSPSGEDLYPVSPPVFFAQVGGRTVALRVPECLSNQGRLYIENHMCLLYGDCSETDYVCDAAYCDAIFVLGEAAPEFEHDGKVFASRTIVKLADRMGVFDCE